MLSDHRTPVLIASFLGMVLPCLGGARASEQAEGGTLIVKVEGFRSTKGRARVAVFNRARGFPDSEPDALRTVAVQITAGRIEARFERLPSGDYAVAMYHDENHDAKFNKGIFGIPKEGYGVSNNIVHKLRAPHFEEAHFRLPAEGKALSIRVTY